MKVLRLPNLIGDTSSLQAALREWAAKESSEWDALVEGQSTAGRGLLGGQDLWDNMPVLDSKAVARSSPIFLKFLGKALDVKFIRPGGYSTVDGMIEDLVPKMVQAAA